MTTPVQAPLPLEASNSTSSFTTAVTDGTVNTGGFASAPTAGNTVIVVVHSEDLSVGSLAKPTSVIDSASNAFTWVGGGMSTATPNERVDVYYRQVATSGQAGARTVVVTKNSSTNFQEVAIYQVEVPGLWTPHTASFVGGGNSTVGQLSLTLTTPVSVPSGAFVITSINIHDTVASTLTPSTPSGYTAIYVESNQAAVMSQLLAYKDKSSTATESVTYTGMTSNSDISSAVIAAFVPPASPTAPSTYLGWSDTQLVKNAWFDDSAITEGLFDATFIKLAAGVSNANITGVSGAGTAGAVTARGNANVTITGVAGTGAVGTVSASGATVVNATATITGVSGSGQAGSVTASGSANASIAGASGSGQAGSTSASGTANIAITGSAASGQAGAVTAAGSATVAVSGVSGAGSAGAIVATGSASVSITGAQGSGQAGTVSASGGSVVNATANISGVAGAGQAGALVATGDANISIAGVQGSGAAGTATASGSTVVNASIGITGVAGTAQVGSVTATGGANKTITGVSAAGLAGVVAGSGSATVSITGVQAQAFIGTVLATAAADITITAARANLIYELALLHGLVPGNPLTVSDAQRSAGALVQTIAGTDTVTITTVSSDVLQGDVNAWIDALAAVHGLTAPLVVTSTARTAGPVNQTVNLVGSTTTVTRV